MTVWEVTVRTSDDGYISNKLFTFHLLAKRYIKKHEKEWQEKSYKWIVESYSIN